MVIVSAAAFFVYRSVINSNAKKDSSLSVGHFIFNEIFITPSTYQQHTVTYAEQYPGDVSCISKNYFARNNIVFDYAENSTDG